MYAIQCWMNASWDTTASIPHAIETHRAIGRFVPPSASPYNPAFVLVWVFETMAAAAAERVDRMLEALVRRSTRRSEEILR
jgi:hypothetical protein